MVVSMLNQSFWGYPIWKPPRCLGPICSPSLQPAVGTQGIRPSRGRSPPAPFALGRKRECVLPAFRQRAWKCWFFAPCDGTGNETTPAIFRQSQFTTCKVTFARTYAYCQQPYVCTMFELHYINLARKQTSFMDFDGRYTEVSWNRGTPSHHPFLFGIFPDKNHPFWIPPWPWKAPYGRNPQKSKGFL